MIRDDFKLDITTEKDCSEDESDLSQLSTKCLINTQLELPSSNESTSFNQSALGSQFELSNPSTLSPIPSANSSLLSPILVKRPILKAKKLVRFKIDNEQNLYSESFEFNVFDRNRKLKRDLSSFSITGGDDKKYRENSECDEDLYFEFEDALNFIDFDNKSNLNDENLIFKMDIDSNNKVECDDVDFECDDINIDFKDLMLI